MRFIVNLRHAQDLEEKLRARVGEKDPTYEEIESLLAQ